ncbi:hypothetical protein ACWIWK_03870 [Helicobacter sp. 23-1048]
MQKKSGQDSQQTTQNIGETSSPKHIDDKIAQSPQTKALTTISLRQQVNKLLKDGFKLFRHKNYGRAYNYFERAFLLAPQNKEAKIGLFLTEHAKDYPDSAHTTYEFYQHLLSSGTSRLKSQKQILKIIQSMDEATLVLSNNFKNTDSKKTQSLDGVLYGDFLEAVSTRGSFKEAFEDIMFSSKLIFTKKKDFYHFLHQLIDNGFAEIGLEYAYSLEAQDYDAEIEKIIKKAISYAPNKKTKLP